MRVLEPTCVFEIQKAIHQRNLTHEEGDRITLRIGIHLGDVVHPRLNRMF